MFTFPTTLVAPGPGGLYLPSSELWYPPESPSIYDDEFEGDLSAWSVVNTGTATGFSAAVAPDLLASFAAGDTRYDINSMRASWLVMQPPLGGQTSIYKYFPGGIPDGTWWFRFQSYFRKDIAVVNNDAMLSLVLSGDAAGVPILTERIELLPAETDASKITNQAQVVNSGVYSQTETSDFDLYGMFQGYGAIIKSGNTFYHFLGGDSGSWKHIKTYTYTGGATITCLELWARNASSGAPGNALMMFDFIRYLSHGDLPG